MNRGVLEPAVAAQQVVDDRGQIGLHAMLVSTMSTLSVDLKLANLLWLQAQAKASGKVDLSRTLNELLDQLRLSANATEVRSVRGTIELPESDLDELDLLRDVQVGLADVEAGRVIAHEEVRELLQKRYAG